MKTSRCLLISALLVIGFFPAWGEDSSKKVAADTTLLQGEWAMVSGEREGQPMPERLVATGTRVAKGNETTVNIGGQLILKATFTLNPATTPKSIDYHVTGGPHLGKTQLGIYEVDGMTAKFCFAILGKERPDSFTTKPDDGRTLSVWKKSVK